MRGELVPAVIGAGGGSAALAAIYWRERRRDEAMRESRRPLALTFPAALEPRAAAAALATLSGARDGTEFICEVRADREGIAHVLAVPGGMTDPIASQLAAVVSGLRARQASESPSGLTTLVLRLYVPRRSVLSTADSVAASRAVLSELARLTDDEEVVIRWALRTGSPPSLTPTEPKSPEDRELARALRQRGTRAGFLVAGLLLIRTRSQARARSIAEHVSGVLRSRHALGPRLGLTSERSGRRLSSLPRTRRSSGWLSVAELLPLLGLPLGDDLIEGVAVGARDFPARRELARTGRQLFVGRDAHGERPVALSPKAALLHSLIVGPTGSGKSTVIARGVLDDLASGYGGVVIDPKNDLVDSIVERVPESHADRVVLLDPAASGPVPGIDLLATGDPDLRSDVVLGALRSIFADAWGVRSDYYGRLALRALSEAPGATLADFGRLFSDASFRRSVVARLSDPLMKGAWQTYEALSPAEQLQHVQAPMARVMALISRPALRAVLAQPAPRLDVGRLLAERKWLLASLAPGTLGEPAARLLGAVLSFVVWAALEARVAMPPALRRPVFLVFDELQALTDLPLSIERIAERARGLGGGLVVGTQTIGRLPEGTRQALLGNLASLVVFRTGAEEAARLARELPGLNASDLQALGAYEVAARVASGTSGVSVVTGRTEPLPPTTGMAAAIRQRSARLYGVDPAETDAHLSRRYEQSGDDGELALGRTRRRP